MPEEVLAPPLTQVLDFAQQLVAIFLGRSPRPAEEVLPRLDEAIDDAGRYLDATRRQVLHLEGSLDANARDMVLDEVERAFDQSRAALAAIRQAGEAENLPVLQSAMDALEESLVHLGDCARTIQSQEKQQATVVPLAPINTLLRAARNRAEAGLGTESVKPWIGPAVSLLARLGRQIEMFAFLHSEATRTTVDARAMIHQLQTGVGAMAQWLETDKAGDLDYACKALMAAWPLSGLLHEMDRLAGHGGEFSSVPALEECYRYVGRLEEAAAEARPALDQAAVERMRSLRHFYRDRIEALARLPLAFAVADAVQAARAAATAFRASQDSFRHGLSGGQGSAMLGVIHCRDAAERCKTAHAELRAALTAELDKTRDFPRLEKLKDSVGRVLQGTMSLRHFVIEFSHQATQLEALYQQSLNAGSGAAPLQYALDTQRQGFQRMSRYFEDFDSEHLVEGLRDVEATLPAMRSLRHSLSNQRRKIKGVSEVAPALLVAMNEWRQAMDSGQMTVSQVLSGVVHEKNRLTGIMQESRSRLTHVIKKTYHAEVQSAAANYIGNISNLVGGFELMELGLRTGAMDRWNQGFEQARNAIMAMEMDVQASL